jgi:excisionase family DNA binding protein
VSIIGRSRSRWVTEGERSHCEAELKAGAAPDEVAMSGLRSGLVKVMVSQRPGGVRRDPPAHTLLTVDDVAEHLGVNVRHVRRLVQERRLRYVKWGRLLRFDPADIAAFVDEHRSTA